MSRKSYVSAINNAHEFLNQTDKLGKKARLEFLESSGLKKFSEKNFKDSRISKRDVIGAYAKIKRDRKTLLDKAWKKNTFRNIKLRNNRRAKGKFFKANRSKILEEIGSGFEMFFESPDVVA